MQVSTIPRWFILSIAILLGIFLGASIYTFLYAKGYSYLSNQPETCTNCHIMREHFDGWQKAVHHTVATCNDCHVPISPIKKMYAKAEHGFRHSYAFTTQNFHEPIQMKISSEQIVLRNCIRCHFDMVNDIHPQFQSRKEKLDCLHCHRSVGHGPIK
ncbi:MAG: cytochrome c nitrite reductase small subunit [bacterium]|nr:cytochrome c nitrite reductase small subunit [bacterium]